MTTGVAIGDGLGQYFNNHQLAEFMQAIRAHERTRTYGGEELVETHQKNCSVVDQSKSTWFSSFGVMTLASLLPWTKEVIGPTTPDGWDPDAEINNFTKTLYDPAYTPIAILFEPFVAAVSGGSVGNKYEVNVRSQFLAHYPQGTMLANMAIDPPTDPSGLTKHRDSEEHKGSVLEKIGSALKDGASWAWNHKGDIMTGAYNAYKFAAPYVRAAPKFVP
jgi:hypothetical protein